MLRSHLFYQNDMLVIKLEMAITGVKGHEHKSYETHSALLVIASLLFNFTIVNMRGLNKSFNISWTSIKPE